MTAGARRVLLAGATGLVGAELLRQLLAEDGVQRVIALARRPFAASTERLDVRTVDFDRLAETAGDVSAEQVFCALGTTIRQAGSREAFRRVDFEYPRALARLGLERGAHHFLLVSALGADARSRVFYNSVKGELEDALRTLGYRSLTIVRPSLLLGDRTDRRWGEEIGKRLAWLVPSRWKPVHAREVAAALVHAAREDEPGVRLIESGEIRREARAAGDAGRS